MKLSYKQVPGFLEKPSTQKGVLFFGPDGGLARDHCKHILGKLTDNPDDPFATTYLEADAIKDEPSKLFEALSGMSLMGGDPIVIIRDGADKITSIIKDALASNECQNYLIICAGDLPTKSSLRKLFDQNKTVASVGCYREEGRDLIAAIQRKFEAEGIRCQRDAMMMLSQSLGNDRGVTNSEIDKIITYLGDEKELTVDDVAEIININDDKGMDDLCIAIANGQTAPANQLCNRLLAEGNNGVTLVRSINRYFARLAQTHGFIASGLSNDEAMKKLYPPVFFKQKNNFMRHLSRIPLVKVRRISQALLKAELDMKRSTNQQIICMRAITSITFLCR